MSTITRTKKKTQIDKISSCPFILIVKNDSYNTFDWVIKCLMDVCQHAFEQASQAANIIHYKGKCDVKYGDFDTLSGMKDKLQNAGISVIIEKN